MKAWLDLCELELYVSHPEQQAVVFVLFACLIDIQCHL
jgi:hypothetical protein